MFCFYHEKIKNATNKKNKQFFFSFFKTTSGVYLVCFALRTEEIERAARSAHSHLSSLLNGSKRAKSTAEASARRLMLIQLMLL